MSFIYGIGNALVDLEFTVTEKKLQEIGIQKGVMSLIDKNQFNHLLKQLPTPKNRECGGSACNTLVGASQLGVPTSFSGRLAQDDNGHFYTQSLTKQHIKSKINLVKSSQTGSCIVLITPDADRTLITYLGESAHFSTKDINETLLKESTWLYIEGYLTTTPNSLQAAMYAQRIARKHQKKIALTLSDPNVVNFCRDKFKTLLNQPIDLLFCNEQEALNYTETKTINNALQELQRFSQQIIITCGANGALIYDGNKCHSITAPLVKAIDTNGAGDLFAGCVFAGLYYNKNIITAAQWGCYAASQLVTQFGPRANSNTLKKINKFIQLKQNIH